MKKLATIDQASLIAFEIKKLLNYDCLINQFLDGHIVTLNLHVLLTSEMKALIHIANKYNTNFQVYGDAKGKIEINCIV